jgi:hypothetical protein
LQFSRPENANLVREALKRAGREDLIGNGKECLVRAAFGASARSQYTPKDKTKPSEKVAKRIKRPTKSSILGKKSAGGKKTSAKSARKPKNYK